MRARGRPSREEDRTSEALPSASPRQQEADPDHIRNEPSTSPDATWRGFQGVGGPEQSHWLDTGRRFKNSRKNAREQRVVSQSPAGRFAKRC